MDGTQAHVDHTIEITFTNVTPTVTTDVNIANEDDRIALTVQITDPDWGEHTVQVDWDHDVINREPWTSHSRRRRSISSATASSEIGRGLRLSHWAATPILRTWSSRGRLLLTPSRTATRGCAVW